MGSKGEIGKLNPIDLIVLAIMREYANKSKILQCSLSQISDLTKLSRSTVNDSIRALLNAKIISRLVDGNYNNANKFKSR